MEEKAFRRQLVQRYMENKATDEELEAFFHLLDQGVLDEHINAYMQQLPFDIGQSRAVARRRRRRRWMAAAALAAVLLGGAIVYIARQQQAPGPGPLASKKEATPLHDIQPGGDNAVLTLADGSTIALDSAGTGSLSVQGSAVVMKQSGGRLAYQATGAATAQQVRYNMLATPRGGKYQLLLPDGTLVLLNAASSLRFPTAFPGGERVVELNGEAYFEVAQRPSQPFRVKLLPGNERTVEVLGTSFNVMAYPDEPTVKTTLVTGAVRVKDNGNTALLSPGQQAIMPKGAAGGIRVEKVNVEEAIAWKNDEFYFSNTDIYSIMRQVSRWYNVEVSYEDSLQVFLNGNIRKNVNASQVIKMLELTGEVKFRTEGRHIIVSSRQKTR